MKIAFFTDTFLPQKNGVVSYVVDLAGELSKRKNQVLVFAPNPGRVKNNFRSRLNFRTEFIPSVNLPLYPQFRNAVPALPNVLYALRLFRPDVVHLNDPFTVCMDGLMAAKILHVPVVFTFHTFFLDDDMLKNIKWGKAVAMMKEPLSRLNAYIHNQSDMIICPSVVSHKELRQYGLTKPSRVVNNSVDISKVVKLTFSERTALRSQYRIENDDKVGIFVGRLSADKSVDIIIKSWKNVLIEFPEAKLLIVGSGPMERELVKLRSQLKLDRQVIFAGPLEREELMAKGIYRIADLFVTASKIENQSVAILEAIVHGLPIVAVDARGNKELVTNNGILVNPDDPVLLSEAIISVFSDSLLAKRYSGNSLKKSTEFSLSEMVVKVENIYNKLVNN